MKAAAKPITSKDAHEPDIEAGFKALEALRRESVLSHSSDSHHTNSKRCCTSTCVLVTLVLILGCLTCAAFLGLGMATAFRTQADQFERSAIDVVNKLQSAWNDYVNAAAIIHDRCRTRNFTRADFRQLYEYLIAGGLEFKAAQFDPNITQDERAYYENETREYYAQNYPEVEYRGFIGFEYANSTTPEPRSVHPFYFPIQYMEPIPGNEAAIDLDYHASGSRRRTVLSCMEHGKPALTDRLRLVQETEQEAYGVVLMHPGYNLTTQPDVWPRDLASIVIRIRDLLARAVSDQGESSIIYVYDLSDSSGWPIFLGAVEVRPQEKFNKASLVWLEEKQLNETSKLSPKYKFEKDIDAANKKWKIVVTSLPHTFKANVTFITLGGAIIFIASIFLAGWVWGNARRLRRYNELQVRAEQERVALVLENARQAAKAERELNDFIAHEVRNPVAAAMAACAFLKTSIYKEAPLSDPQSLECARDDTSIIENALKFVNDLLRNMLDMHRAANKQIKVDMTPTDLLHDVVEPVGSMLHQREGGVKVILQCPHNLVIMSDRLRLKQVLLNLGRNAAKFVDRGFILIKAEVVGETVLLSVEDSGPGIPLDKHDRLFTKYQESLDVLSQGTVRYVISCHWFCVSVILTYGGVVLLIGFSL
jgi:CHASE1-domain containing sensor protein